MNNFRNFNSKNAETIAKVAVCTAIASTLIPG